MIALRLARRAFAVALAAAVAATTLPTAAQEADPWEGLAMEGVEAFNRGDNDYALGKFAEALELARRFPPGDERVVNSLLNMAVTLRRLRRFEQAEVYYLEAIRLQEEAQDPDLVVSLDALGLLYNEIGHAARAETMFRRAIARLEEIAGPEHPYTGLVMEHLAEAMVALGRYEDAATVLGRIVDIRAATFGPNHRSLAPPLTRQGLAYMALSRNLDAMNVLRRALAIWRVGPQPAATELLLTLEALVDLSQNLGRLRDAADYQRQVVVVRAVQTGERGALFADELDEYARLLRRAGDPAQADDMEARARVARQQAEAPRP